jgi:mono/diheme cytochrome c family protein
MALVPVLLGVLGLPSLAHGSEAGRDASARFARAHEGDAARGREVFADAERAACIGCHRVRGEGGDVGPDLSNIGGKFGREHLVESVLEPSRQIVEG